MSTEMDPITGAWYQHLDKGQEFQVIDVDETSGIVATQHFDGDIEQFSLDDWYELDLENIEPPEDWTGPVDEIEEDDLGYSDTSMAPDEWTDPLAEIRSSDGAAGDAEPEEASDDAPDRRRGIELVPYRE